MAIGPEHDPHLLSSEEALQAVIQNAPVSISVIDKEGRLVFAAGKGLELIEMTSDVLIGAKATDLFPEEKQIPDLMKKVFSGQTVTATLDIKRRMVDIWGSPIRSKDGKIAAVIVVATDVTERESSLRKLAEIDRILAIAEQAAQFGIWYSDPAHEGDLVWTDGAYRIFGLTRKEFDGRVETFFKMVHPGDVDRVRKASLDALAGGPRYNVEHRIILADGRIRWVHQEADVIFGKDKKPMQMVGMTQDITDRKAVEQALKERESVLRKSEARYRAMVEHSYELIHMIDATGKISYMGPAVERMLGYEPQELLGKIGDSFVHPDDIAAVQAGLKLIMDTPGQATPPTDMRVRRKDGGYLNIEAVAHNLLHIPEVEAVVVHSRDVTGERKATEELKKRNNELEQFVRLTTGREIAMMKLKQENEELRKRLADQP